MAVDASFFRKLYDDRLIHERTMKEHHVKEENELVQVYSSPEKIAQLVDTCLEDDVDMAQRYVYSNGNSKIIHCALFRECLKNAYKHELERRGFKIMYPKRAWFAKAHDFIHRDSNARPWIYASFKQ